MIFFDKIVLENLQKNFAPQNFLSAFDGTYLYEIKKTLDKIQNNEIQSNSITKAYVSKILAEIQRPFDRENYFKQVKDFHYTPVPHILDSDWRFTREAAFSIAEMLESQTSEKQKLALLGIPSISIALEEKKSLIDRTLYEKNPLSLVNSNIVQGDINQIQSNEQFNIVACDSPWYPVATKNFMVAAQKIMKKCAKLFIVVPPYGVREGMNDEYDDIINFGYSIGLDLKDIQNHKVDYFTPPFEINSLLSVGITNFSLNWRKGNLMVFEKSKDVKINIQGAQNKNDQWAELYLGKIRIKIKRNTETHIPMNIENLVEGDIYPTVSMRTTLKDDVDIWTSGNRIFKCSNTSRFKEILSAMIARIDLQSLNASKTEIQTVFDLINGIEKKENQEYAEAWE